MPALCIVHRATAAEALLMGQEYQFGLRWLEKASFTDDMNDQGLVCFLLASSQHLREDERDGATTLFYYVLFLRGIQLRGL